MATDSGKPTAWLTSQEARRQLRISDCELMHLRESGALRFQKRGAAYFYARADVERRKADEAQ